MLTLSVSLSTARFARKYVTAGFSSTDPLALSRLALGGDEERALPQARSVVARFPGSALVDGYLR